MRTIDWCVESATKRFSVSGTIEVEDDATEDEIKEMVNEEVFNVVSWGWSEREK